MSVKLLLTLALMMALASALRLTSHQDQYAWFTFDEGPTGNKCSSASQCDGQRTCSQNKETSKGLQLLIQ